MSKLYLILSLTLIFYSSKALDTLRVDEEITRQLELEFNEAAKNAEAYIKWALIGDWEKFDYIFNQGMLKNDQLTINASEYKSFLDGNYGINLSLKPKKNTDEGMYQLKMEVFEVNGISEFDDTELNLSLRVYIVTPPPQPWWIKLVCSLVIIVVLLHIIWFIFLKKSLFPKMAGTIQFEDGSLVKLNNCYAFYLYTSSKKPSYAKSGIISEIYCGKKGSYPMPYPDAFREENKYILIKPVKSKKGHINTLIKINNIELLSFNKKLYHEEEYSFKDSHDEQVISFTYDNAKHQIGN